MNLLKYTDRVNHNKLILILPPSPWLLSDRDQPVTGILYVSSWLKLHGHDVTVCDLAGIPEEHWHIPVGDVYGVTGTTPHFPYIRKIIEKIRRREPNKMIVAGGVHATALPQHILDKTQADVIVVGEGEHTMLEIMDGVPLEKINGVMTRDFRNPPRQPEKNLDKFPFPDREGLDYFDYMVPDTYKYLGTEREGSIMTARGCPFECAYCASPILYSRIVKYRSPENVYEELKYLKEYYGMGLCNFVDDTFVMNKQRVSDICDLIRPLDIKWFFLTRVDCIDEDLFKKMVDVGCQSVTYGFESGSDRILESLRKKCTIAQADNAIKISKRAGLKIRGQLMVGLPGETDEDVELTADFIRNHPEIDSLGLHVFQPFPGSAVWNENDLFQYDIDMEHAIETNFSDYHTIGKKDWEVREKQTAIWYDYLISVIADRDIKLATQATSGI
jgi:radical SAM superfamily enzyme YgiQ (UPF0313 family)